MWQLAITERVFSRIGILLETTGNGYSDEQRVKYLTATAKFLAGYSTGVARTAAKRLWPGCISPGA
ncbi:hypothetical protein ACQK5W_01885 [Pantoea sp. FN060301]|uniref:hypothetical protein n=1 Tax=Pantoea sp. FN060301 TaxID=3420380 RepID=UPI003D182B35